MVKRTKWTDEYWLLLMQLYLRKPVGVKPIYSRGLVDLSIELHIPPQVLYERMFRLRQIDTPMMEMLWRKYGKSPKKLSREVELLRKMEGFGSAGSFYEGVELNESFELDFKPLPMRPDLTPAMLIRVLDRYFRLTPITMVGETPEIIELARLLKTKPEVVAEVMLVYQYCDPYLNRQEILIDPLLAPCGDVWQRFGNGNPEKLSAFAAQLREYFK